MLTWTVPTTHHISFQLKLLTNYGADEIRNVFENENESFNFLSKAVKQIRTN